MKILLIPLIGIMAVACSSSGDNGASGTTSTPAATSTTGTTGTTGAPAATTGATAAAGGSGFASVAGIFSSSCMPCHGAQRHRGGLSLADYAGTMKGGDDGPVVKAGDPDNSLLIKLLHGPSANPKIAQMPMGGKPLSDADIQKVSDWVKAGAKES